MECKYCDEFTGVCTNGDCPMRGDCCPVPDTEGICKYEEREEELYVLSPKGCASVALMDAGLVAKSNDSRIDVFWEHFTDLMNRFGYIQEAEDGQ